MDEVFTALIDEIFRLNGALLVAGDRIAATSGLTAARWQVLGRIADGPTTVAAIARGRGLKRQSVQETVTRLERDGMIGRARNPDDLRAPIVSITAAGRDALRRIEPVRAEWARSTPAALHEQQLATALETLRSVRKALE